MGGRVGLVVLLVLAEGCATPLLHPLRAAPGSGAVAENAFSFAISAGRHGSCDEGGCRDHGSRAFVPNFLQLSLGYSALKARHFGLMAGVYFPAWESIRSSELYAALAAYTYATVQNKYAAVGFGPEVGVGGWAITSGADLQPWGAGRIRPGIGVYSRFFFPFVPRYQDFDGRMATWEVGGRLNVGPVYVQYAYVSQYSGVYDHLVYESSFYEQAFHIISIGVTTSSLVQALRVAGTIAGAMTGNMR